MAAYERNHIVPGGHTALFASEGLVQCHFLNGAESKPLSPRDVGVRCRFHARGPNARQLSEEWEKAMGKVEQPAIEWMKVIEEHWPPTVEERAVMTEYLALQIVRGPAFREFFDSVRADSLKERKQGLRPDQQDQLEAWSGSDEFRLESIQTQIGRIGTLVGHLSWAQLRFSGPRVISSDQPVVPVAVLGGVAQSARAMPRGGLMNTVEFRFPVCPDRALLLSWHDDHDEYPVIDGKSHHLKALNSSIRAQADVQWFHLPGVSAPSAATDLMPLSFQFFPDYDLLAAATSERRRLAEQTVIGMLETRQRSRITMLRAEPATRHIIESGRRT